jgi:anaerobic magnesium-protoporphyrin IX monomethyl ester cyclase
LKVLLINPPFQRFMGLEQNYPHLGLAYLGTYLEQVGHDVVIRNFEMPLNGNLSYVGYSGRMDAHQLYLDALENDNHAVWQEVRDTIELVSPEVVGVTARTVQVPSALKIAKIAKEYGVQVAIGGIHATARPQDFDSPYVDEVVQGEGESSAWSILPERMQLTDIDVDYCPIPNRDLFMEQYNLEGLGHMITTRGCPFSCTFCSQQVLWGKKVRFRSVENILDEMVMLDDKYGVKLFRFWDDSFTLRKDRIVSLCQAILTDHSDRWWTWHCDTRLDLLNEFMLHNMMSAGCIRMSLGVESGSPRVLDMVKKGEAVEQLKEKAQLLRRVGSEYDDFQWRIYVMAGFPTETDEEIQMTWDLTKELNPDRICLSTFTFYPGTEIYEEGLVQGWVEPNRNWAKYSHQVSDRPIIRKFAEWVDGYNAERGGRWV